MLKPKTNERLFFLLLIVAILGVGCATTNWNNRIGKYSYDQVVEELGEPTSTKKLDNGDLLGSWLDSVLLNTGTPTGGGKVVKWKTYYWKIFTFNSDGFLKEVKEVKEEGKMKWGN